MPVFGPRKYCRYHRTKIVEERIIFPPYVSRALENKRSFVYAETCAPPQGPFCASSLAPKGLHLLLIGRGAIQDRTKAANWPIAEAGRNLAS